MIIYGRYKAGRLSNGFESDKGYIIHAVQENSHKALCGTDGWLPFSKEEYLSLDKVTCKRCLKKIN